MKVTKLHFVVTAVGMPFFSLGIMWAFIRSMFKGGALVFEIWYTKPDWRKAE